MNEIETRILNIEVDVIRERAFKIGAVLVKKENQINNIFDFSDGRLLKSKGYARIRTIDDLLNNKKLAYITTKKMLSQEVYKVMEEHETEIGDPLIGLEIFKALGLEIINSISKYRESYKYKNTLIEIDINDTSFCPFPYIEIESNDENELLEVITLLGYKKEDATSKTIFEILKEYNNAWKIKEFCEIMFGYITPCRMELKIKDFETFKAYYCGLCKEIKKSYGTLPSMTLNYDMTFLAILFDSLKNTKTEFTLGRCMAHVVKKRPYVKSNEALEYAAFFNVALVYYKLVDDQIDDNSIKANILSKILSTYFKRFPNNLKPAMEKIKINLASLTTIEHSSEVFSLDEISHPFASLTGEILSFYINSESETKETLYWLGYNLGKWIYLIDAFDDLEKDIKNNKFNPILKALEYDKIGFELFKNKVYKRIEFNLLTTARLSLENLNKLELYKNSELLNNILQLGLMEKTQMVLSGCNKKEKL